MAVDKNILKRINILYVEDDTVIRTELSQLLTKFFAHVYTAEDGKDAFETYLKNQDAIDVIITDINMPKLSGIDFIKEVRKLDTKIPVIFATAHSDNDFLADAIKLKAHEYVVKPIDVRLLIESMSELANSLYQEELLSQQNQELESFKHIVDSNNIVLKTDVHMNITYVNELFCKITGYDNEELIGKEFKELKHPDISNDLYVDIYAKVLNNIPWKGVLKNLTKDHGTYITECHMMARIDDSGEIVGTICIQKDITEEHNKKRDIQLALMKDKSDIFKRSKEGTAEQTALINELTKQVEEFKKETAKAKQDVDKYIYTAEKFTVENRNLKRELAAYKKSADTHGVAMKVSKENADLRLENKRLQVIIEEEKEKFEKDLNQQRVKFQIDIETLKDEISDLNDKLESIESDEVLKQKLDYWREKAKTELQRVERLEKQIIAHGDENFLAKIFG